MPPRWLRVLLPVALLVSFPASGLPQSGNLAELNEIKIVVDGLTPYAEELGLTEDVLTEHVLVFLQRKMSRLKLNDSAPSYIVVDVRLAPVKDSGASRQAYFGNVALSVLRPASILDNRLEAVVIKIAPVWAWNRNTTLTGPPTDIGSHVRQALDKLLGTFAADWYRANPE